MKNWQGIPTTRLTLGGEVMVPRDNSTLAFSTELLNYIIAFAAQEESGHCKIFDSFKMPAKVTGDSLLIHEFTYPFNYLLVSVRSPPA